MAEPDFGHWAIVTATTAQGVVICRLRRDQPQDAGGHAISVTISWPYEGDERGLPRPVTLAAMDAFEVAVDELTLQPGLSYLMLVMTGLNLRHYTFYVSTFDAFVARFNALLQDHPRVPIDITYVVDSAWKTWRSMRDRASN